MSRSAFALLLIPVFFAACSQNNVTEDSSLQKYFDSAGVKGSFGFFDNGQGHFTIYNLPRFRDSLYQPAGTFDLVLSLIGIQTGIVKDDSAIGFQASIHRIGRDTVKKWVDSLGYGNKDLGHDDTAFWYDNHLKISSDEQLGLIKKLYFDQLPFFKRTQLVTRRMIPSEKNSNYELFYKSGQGIKEDGHAIGWVMGWVEENKHPYFFVLNLESPNPTADLPAAGLSVARGILTQWGFFQGKK
ncbi:MAG TPA: penicillin-binding transpeptidase domain-containing protein [Puia sp.]|jgi:beta-lactamase class D